MTEQQFLGYLRLKKVDCTGSTEANLLGTSFNSPYVPLLAFATGEIVLHEKKRIIIYETFLSKNRRTRVRNYGEPFGVFHSFLIGLYPEGVLLTTVTYHMHMFTLIRMKDSIPEVLFTLTVKRENFWSFYKKPSLEGLVLVIKRDFLTNVNHANIRSKIKPFLTELESLGIPFLLVSDVTKYCFNAPLILPKFRTLQEKLEYFSDLHNFIPKAEETDEQKRARLAQEASQIHPPETVTTTNFDFTRFA